MGTRAGSLFTKSDKFFEKWEGPGPESVIGASKDSPLKGMDTLDLIIKKKGVNLEREINYSKDLHASVSEFFTEGFKFLWYSRKITKGIIKSYKELRENDTISPDGATTFPNNQLWKDLNDYVRNWSDVKVAFTKVPEKLIFKDRYILFPYALICMMEMKKDKIKKAPRMGAGVEAIRVYANLGNVVNDIAQWLRKRGIKCQPCHPVGGLLVTPPLAGKAGLGWRGKMGLLLSPEFGIRQRLAPIFVEEKIFEFTDSQEHKWIEDYCKTCGNCARKCPGGAILDEPLVNVSDVEGIGNLFTCVDLPKCYKHFSLKFGCSVCVDACPFSAGGGNYYKIKEKFEKRLN